MLFRSSVPVAVLCQPANIPDTVTNQVWPPVSSQAWQPLYSNEALANQSSTNAPTNLPACLSKWVNDSQANFPANQTKGSPPTSVDLASLYSSTGECKGILPFGFTPQNWEPNETPCKVILNSVLGGNGAATTSITVFFQSKATGC